MMTSLYQALKSWARGVNALVSAMIRLDGCLELERRAQLVAEPRQLHFTLRTVAQVLEHRHPAGPLLGAQQNGKTGPSRVGQLELFAHLGAGQRVFRPEVLFAQLVRDAQERLAVFGRCTDEKGVRAGGSGRRQAPL